MRRGNWGGGEGGGTRTAIIMFVSGKGQADYRPAAEYGSTKYGGNNRRSMRMEGEMLQDNVREQLEELYSYGLAKGTWSSYGTAERLIRTCFREKGIPLELPIEEGDILVFIHWLAFTRGLTGATIETYLSGIRQMHVTRGMEEHCFKTERVKLIIKGLKHRDTTEKRRAGEESRRPITMDILEKLKGRIANTDFAGRDQRMVWSVCSILFHGAFRVHELLCKKKSSFDPDFTLLEQDVILGEEEGREVIRFRIKAPKEEKTGKSVMVDVYETGTDICPVRAFRKWDKFRVPELDMPVFRFSSGVPLTGQRLNEILRACLKGHVEGSEKLFSSHSFRAGAASHMAMLGCSDKEIKAVGRWSSRAFLEYVKLPRSQRAEVARRWGNMK